MILYFDAITIAFCVKVLKPLLGSYSFNNTRIMNYARKLDMQNVKSLLELYEKFTLKKAKSITVRAGQKRTIRYA